MQSQTLTATAGAVQRRKGLGADAGEKHEPAGDIDTAAVDTSAHPFQRPVPNAFVFALLVNPLSPDTAPKIASVQAGIVKLAAALQIPAVYPIS